MADACVENKTIWPNSIVAQLVVESLTAKVQYLVDNWPAPLEDGCFSFPDGDFWAKTSNKHGE